MPSSKFEGKLFLFSPPKDLAQGSERSPRSFFIVPRTGAAPMGSSSTTKRSQGFAIGRKVLLIGVEDQRRAAVDKGVVWLSPLIQKIRRLPYYFSRVAFLGIIVVMKPLAIFVLLNILASSVGLADVYNTEWENVSAQGKPAAGKSEGPTQAEEEQRELEQEQNREAEQMRTESAKRVRRFHEVVDELFAEFGYDVRMGQLKGLKNLAIRKVFVSDAIPNTYESYIELLVAERIRENSRVRLITCTPCKTKKSRLVEGKLLITSPTTNMAEMRQAADRLGIDHFMDIVLVYHSTHMVLAMQVFNTDTQEMIWARTYNSETIKSRYQKLAIDYKQVAKSRPGEDYVPEYRFLFGLGGAMIPNTSGDSQDSSMLSAVVRGTEKFNNRQQEFGLHLNLFIAKTAFVKAPSGNATDTTATDGTTTDSATTDSTPKAFSFALGLYGMYVHNLIGSLESYNQIRHSLNIGVGALIASAYLAGSVRLGWDLYFGRRFAANFGAFYVAPSEVVVNDEYVKVAGGAGGEIGMSVNI